MSTHIYRQTTGHIQYQMYKNKVYVYTFIVTRLVIYSSRCIKTRFMSTPLYRQTTGHIQQQMYKEKLYVYTFIQARRLVIYIYVYIFIQTDDWSYTVAGIRLVIYSSRCIKKSYMSTPLYRQMTGHIQQQMYKDKVYVYTFIQADHWSYTVVDV